MNNELLNENSKSKLEKLIARLYYDINYYKIILKIGVSKKFTNQFSQHLKNQIDEYLRSRDHLSEHKNTLVQKISDFSSNGIFLEKKGTFSKYVFTFMTEDLILAYEIVANEILKQEPATEIYRFNSILFLNKYLKNEFTAQDGLIYTYNFSTDEIDELKSKVKNKDLQVYNKKMSMRLSNGGMICFDDF